MPRPKLLHDEILRLHEAAVRTHLLDARDTLLGGIDPAFIAVLPTRQAPIQQILSDLHQLNDARVLADGTAPLQIWLENAIAIVGARAEATVFKEFLLSAAPPIQTTFGLSDIDTANKEKATPCAEPPSRGAEHTASGPPRPERFIGRDPLALELVGLIVSESPRPVAILGPAGIGKSTLSLEALHRREVVSRYGARRWFVRLDAATTAEAAVGKIAEALGVSMRGSARAEVNAALAREPAVVVLDNLETPWEGELEATEALLAELVAIPGIVLVASIRGALKPAGVGWGKTIRVDPLTPDLSAELFCTIAPEHRSNATLHALLGPLGGVPLAITLLAYEAEGNDLQNLTKEWAQHRTALLKRPMARPDRLSSWAVSIELSIASKRMTQEARRLGALVAALPDGIAVEDFDYVFPGGNVAARVLAQIGIGFFEGGRLQMLMPIRQHLMLEHAPDVVDLKRAMDYYGALAVTDGPKVGKNGGAGAVARLTPNMANIEVAIRWGLSGSDVARWIDAATALNRHRRFTGRLGISLFTTALEAARTSKDKNREALCIETMGHLASYRADHGEASERFTEALSLYRALSNMRGEANCLHWLGHVELDQWNNDAARCYFDQAQVVNQQLRDVQLEAEYLEDLAELERRRANLDKARSFAQDALRIHTHRHSAYEIANCHELLGDIDADAARLGDAEVHYETAQELFEKTGDPRGAVNIVIKLGHVYLALHRIDEAGRVYHTALPLVRGMESIPRQAECIRGLGDIAAILGKHDDARVHFETALKLYARVPDPYSMGWSYRCLARLPSDPVEKQGHIDAARALWRGISRPDLVAALDEEFGPGT